MFDWLTTLPFEIWALAISVIAWIGFFVTAWLSQVGYFGYVHPNFGSREIFYEATLPGIFAGIAFLFLFLTLWLALT